MGDFVDISYSMFFDKPAVMNAVSREKGKRLSKAGAFVRKRAKSSIRNAPKKRRVSEPGKPPYNHEGSLRKLILFGFDRTAESVVVGPKLFKAQDPPAPGLLEFGGTVTRITRSRSGKTRVRRLHYEERPFMAPALDKEKDNFRDVFANSVRG